MKLAVALLMAVGSFAVDEFTGITSSGSQTAVVSTTLLADYAAADPTADAARIWWIETESFYDHDTGIQWLRVTH